MKQALTLAFPTNNICPPLSKTKLNSEHRSGPNKILRSLFLMLTLIISIPSFGQFTIHVEKSSYIGNYNISCNGASDGWFSILTENGTPPYLYTVNNDTTDSNISHISAGSYLVIVIDSTGTIDSLTVNLQEPAAIVVVLAPIEISCH